MHAHFVGVSMSFIDKCLLLHIFDTILYIYTWEHLPYMEVFKSVHRPADGCSSIHTKNCGTKLPTVAVLWSFLQNCQRLQFYGPFWDP